MLLLAGSSDRSSAGAQTQCSQKYFLQLQMGALCHQTRRPGSTDAPRQQPAHPFVQCYSLSAERNGKDEDSY